MSALGLTGRRGVVAAVVAVALAAALAVTWWTRPTALEPGPARLAARVAVGAPADVVLVPSFPAERLRLRSVEPELADGGASATVEVLLCATASSCTSSRPAAPDTRTRRGESLVVRVVPQERGDVDVVAVRVRYSRDARHLWQTGTQVLDTQVRVTTP